jgi:hypothetical protein
MNVKWKGEKIRIKRNENDLNGKSLAVSTLFTWYDVMLLWLKTIINSVTYTESIRLPLEAARLQR